MNNFGTATKTGVKTSTKVVVGLIAAGSIVAGLVMLQKRGFINSKLMPSSSTTTPPTSTTSTTSTVGVSGPGSSTTPTSTTTTTTCSTIGVSGPECSPSPTSPTTSTSSTISTTPVCTEADWTSSVTPRICPASGVQTRTWIKTGNCVNGVRHVSRESIYCISGV